MDFTALSNIIIIIFIPLLILFIGSFFFYVYDFLTNAHKNVIKNEFSIYFLFNIRKQLFFKGERKYILNLIIVFYLIIAILLSYLIAYNMGISSIGFNNDLLLMLFFFIIPVIFSGIYYKSQKLYSSSKEFFTISISYYVPIILSVLSIYIYLVGSRITNLDLNVLELVNFQNFSQIEVNKILLPALFIIINPFAALAFFTGTMGIFKTYRSSLYNENQLNQKLFSKILRNTSFFLLISLFILLFLGGGYFFSGSLLLNIPMFIMLCFIIVVLISLIDNDRPKLFIERKIWKFINIPMIISLVAVFYSLFLIYYGSSLIQIQL